MAFLVPLSLNAQENPQNPQPTPKNEIPAQPTIVLDSAILRSIFDDAVKIYTDEKAANQETEERKERREHADLLAQQKMAK